MYRKMNPNDTRFKKELRPGDQPADLNNIWMKLRNSHAEPDDTSYEGKLLGVSLLDHARRQPSQTNFESPLNQLRQFRKAFHENPDLLNQLGLDDEQNLEQKGGYSGTLGDLEYTKELPGGIKLSNNNLDPLISHASLFGTHSALKNLSHKEEFKLRFLPFFCNLVERKVTKRRKAINFAAIKEEFHLKPLQGLALAQLELIIKGASRRYFFETMAAIMETDTILTEKLKEFYRMNLKRILFTSLKEHKSFQRTWVVQVRDTIRKSVVFDVFRRNAYLEKMERKAKVYHKSRVFACWKRVTAEDRLQWRAMVDEFRRLCEGRLASSILVELRSNALAGKQERKRDMEAIMQYQKVRLFRIFEFWKSVSLKRKKPVDLSKYRGMNSIPIRVTQKKNIELLDEDVSKVLKTRNVSTSYKLMPPTLKI
jgi:hypothetical protein